MTSLTVRGVSASYGTTQVLRDVDLTVASGTTTAILGASGCGKTTLLRVVAGFHPADAGEVLIGDRLVVGPRVQVPAERRGIGYVAQEGSLFPHLSVGDNIAFGLARRDRSAAARVGELLELVGLPADLGRRRPDQLSGGQQQRVALARALARRPGVVLLDEPFSSLDAGLRTSTRRAVADALAAEGVTVLLVTHDQGEALSFADQVAIMREGRFVQVGGPAEVYAAPADRATAAFLGDLVVVPGTAREGRVETPLGSLAALEGGTSGPVDVALRPEQVRLGAPAAAGVRALVVSTDYFGHDALVRLEVEPDGAAADGTPALVLARVTGEATPHVGDTVSVTVTGPVRTYPR